MQSAPHFYPDRREDIPVIAFDFLGFQFRARKTMWRKGEKRVYTRSDKSLTELAAMYNPCIRGWITYYGHFYKTQLRPTLTRIDAYVIRWSRRQFKRMRHRTKGARDWFDRFRRANPHLFAHWVLCYGNGRTSGAM
jgi:hypothetical protein